MQRMEHDRALRVFKDRASLSRGRADVSAADVLAAMTNTTFAPSAYPATRPRFGGCRHKRVGRAVRVDKPGSTREDADLCPFAAEAFMPITLVIIAITAIVSFMAFKNARLMNDLILWPPAISRQHEYYRLVTYGVVHADFGHLLFNMFTLFFFGGLVVSILPTYLKNRANPNYRSLGASGAVSAVLFAYILIAPWQLIIVLVIPMPAIVYAVLYTTYSIYMDRRGQGNINHSAHLWGAAYGVLFTILINHRVLPHFLDALLHPGF